MIHPKSYHRLKIVVLYKEGLEENLNQSLIHTEKPLCLSSFHSRLNAIILTAIAGDGEHILCF